MRVRIDFESDREIALSSGYHSAIQGMLYTLLEPGYRDFLHDKGYRVGKRSFKLFTFSPLLGSYKRVGDLMKFSGRVTLIVSSPLEAFINQICRRLVENPEVELEIYKIKATGLTIMEEPNLDPPIYLKTISPITTYSTLFTKDGRKKTYYYSPYEKEFSELITENLRKKASLIFGNRLNGEVTLGGVRLEPVSKPREIFLSFKRTIIRAWHGIFRVDGDANLIKVGYSAGFGSKNSAGFGMVDVIGNARLNPAYRKGL